MERQQNNELSLKDRILQISYENKLSHLGSSLSAVDAIEAIYKVKKNDEKFVLSNGHAGLALYTVLEKYYWARLSGTVDAESLFKKHGVHPNRDVLRGIEVSTGSLGQGLPIATGMAIARPDRNVYCMVSDGEMSEGSMWEALRVGSELNLTNLKVVGNFNGYAAYKDVDPEELFKRIDAFGWQVDVVDGHNQEIVTEVLQVSTPQPHFIAAITEVEQYPFLQGLGAHYHTMSENDYAQT